MNRKYATISLLILGFLLVTALTSLSQEKEGPFVSDSGYQETMRPPVAFDHDSHNEAAELDECTVCHHVYDESGNLMEDDSSEEMECSECHLKEGDTNRMNLTKYYHLSCRGCHIETKKGPVMCAECHRK